MLTKVAFLQHLGGFSANIVMVNESSSSPYPASGASKMQSRRVALRGHKFSVGQSVYFTASPMGRAGASGVFKIVKLLPSEGDDYQYRIKSPGEAFERVAKESQLDRA
jgi:hypothetical protein